MKKLLVFALATSALATTATVAQAEDFSDHTVVLHYAEVLRLDSVEPDRINFLQRDVGNGQLSGDFVYNDPRAAWDTEAELSFGVNEGNDSADAGLTDQFGWMREAFNVWQVEECSGLTLVENTIVPGQQGLVQNFFNGGGIDISLTKADVTQVGFLSPAEFSYFAGNPNVLGVAFTLSWVDGQGNLTDIDNNGKTDVALREIYYNDGYQWSDDGSPGIDFPTVAIHEVGHGLSAAHFGLIALQKGQLMARPRSIMNAIYGGPRRELDGRDIASHCSNWAQWPNR